jgi:hypothetical protein
LETKCLIWWGQCNAHQTLYEFGENCLTCGLTRRKYPLKNWKVLRKEIAKFILKQHGWFIYLKVCVSLVAVYEMQWSVVSWKVDKMPVLWAISVHHTYWKVKLSCHVFREECLDLLMHICILMSYSYYEKIKSTSWLFTNHVVCLHVLECQRGIPHLFIACWLVNSCKAIEAPSKLHTSIRRASLKRVLPSSWTADKLRA